MKIALIGPESVGKTTIGQRLAEQLSGVFVEEYARGYVERLGRDYTEADVEHIAKVQIAQLSADYPSDPVFFDTDLIITRVWFEHRWGRCPEFVTEGIDQHWVDAYLLFRPDLPFVSDPVRENPDIREQLYDRYLELIRQTRLPYRIVSGQGEERLRCALRATSDLCSSPREGRAER